MPKTWLMIFILIACNSRKSQVSSIDPRVKKIDSAIAVYDKRLENRFYVDYDSLVNPNSNAFIDSNYLKLTQFKGDSSVIFYYYKAKLIKAIYGQQTHGLTANTLGYQYFDNDSIIYELSYSPIPHYSHTLSKAGAAFEQDKKLNTDSIFLWK